MAGLLASEWARKSRRDFVNERYHPRQKSWGAPSRSEAQHQITVNGHVPGSDLKTNASGLQGYDRLLRRLEWKCQLLLCSHHTVNQSIHDATETDNGPATAMTQLKLDFFEFYSLLERTLLHLLGLFHVKVTRIEPDAESEGTLSSCRHKTPTMQNHRFHQNVLRALDQPGPLHDVLGHGKVREYLDYLKDLRNRWKDAGEVNANGSRSIPYLDGEEPDDRGMPSRNDMDKVFIKIFEGLHEVRPLIEEADRKRDAHSKTNAEITEVVDQMSDEMAMDLDPEDSPFEVVTEEMEIG